MPAQQKGSVDRVGQQTARERRLAELDDLVLQEFHRYDFSGEGIVWPSHERIAEGVGVHRSTVTRCVHRLIDDGRMKLVERRVNWRTRSGWAHNVYEMLEPPIRAISHLAFKAITRAAHALKAYSGARPCNCGVCREDRPEKRRPPPFIESQIRLRTGPEFKLWIAADMRNELGPLTGIDAAPTTALCHC